MSFQLIQLQQGIGGDSLDLGHDVVRVLQLDHCTQSLGIKHAEHMAAMRHLHGRRVRVAVHGDHLDTQIRGVRRDAMQNVKDLLKDKQISEDEERKAELDVQKLTDKFVADVDAVCKIKEQELMSL